METGLYKTVPFEMTFSVASRHYQIHFSIEFLGEMTSWCPTEDNILHLKNDIMNDKDIIFTISYLES